MINKSYKGIEKIVPLRRCKTESHVGGSIIRKGFLVPMRDK